MLVVWPQLGEEKGLSHTPNSSSTLSFESGGDGAGYCLLLLHLKLFFQEQAWNWWQSHLPLVLLRFGQSKLTSRPI